MEEGESEREDGGERGEESGDDISKLLHESFKSDSSG